MYENVKVVKIPKERKGILIGTHGVVRKTHESELGVELEIDSEGEVSIYSTEDQEDPLALWKARDIVKAIGRGFNPEKALNIVSD